MRSRHKSKQNSKRNLARKYGVTHMYIWPREWRYSCNKEQRDRSAGLAALWALLFSCQRRWGSRLMVLKEEPHFCPTGLCHSQVVGGWLDCSQHRTRRCWHHLPICFSPLCCLPSPAGHIQPSHPAHGPGGASTAHPKVNGWTHGIPESLRLEKPSQSIKPNL